MEVRIENLTKTFVGRKGVKTTAVSQMSFTIPDGKLVGLLGPSGCGKSTKFINNNIIQIDGKILDENLAKEVEEKQKTKK